jgi:hypothetical protein
VIAIAHDDSVVAVNITDVVVSQAAVFVKAFIVVYIVAVRILHRDCIVSVAVADVIIVIDMDRDVWVTAVVCVLIVRLEKGSK